MMQMQYIPDNMPRYIDGWHSPSLNKHMEIVTYGHYGDALLMLPTAAADYLEYERFFLIKALEKFIMEGKFKVFSVNSINSESWLNNDMHPPHKGFRHNQFNDYIYNEVVPYIKNATSQDTPIYTCGASLGALHSMNLFMKRPDLINGVIAMSGDYDLTSYTKGFWDDSVYFNSPKHYMENMPEGHLMNQIRSSKHIHIFTGSGNYESPNQSRYFSALLNHKGVPHELDVWGHDMPHDWTTWRVMLPYILETRF